MCTCMHTQTILGFYNKNFNSQKSASRILFPPKKQFFKCPHTVWKLSFNKYTDSPGRNRSHIYLCLFTTTRGGCLTKSHFLWQKSPGTKKWTPGGGGRPFHYFFIYTHSGGSRCRASVIKMYVPRAGRPKI